LLIFVEGLYATLQTGWLDNGQGILANVAWNNHIKGGFITIANSACGQYWELKRVMGETGWQSWLVIVHNIVGLDSLEWW
jgi:hypothetical protein